MTNAAGAIAECVKLPHNHEVVLKADGIPAIVNLLNYTNENLLGNVTKIIAECAVNFDCIQKIIENDGIRLLWSLLRSSFSKVQASAAWALVPCIQNANVSFLNILKELRNLIISLCGIVQLFFSYMLIQLSYLLFEGTAIKNM